MHVENNYANTISVVFPAVPPSGKCDLPIDSSIRSHITVSILGETDEVDFSKEELVSVLRDVPWEQVEEVEVERFALFGIRSDFLVMQLNSAAIQKNWERVNEALDIIGISTLDKFPNYHPHLTLKHNYEGPLPAPDLLPATVKVNSPVLWWGKETIPLT